MLTLIRIVLENPNISATSLGGLATQTYRVLNSHRQNNITLNRTNTRNMKIPHYLQIYLNPKSDCKHNSELLELPN